MADGIINFYETAKAREFARDFQFRVVSFGPLNSDDLVYLRTANLPGRIIANHQVPYMGLKFNVPGSTVYEGSDNWPVTFLLDEGANVRSKMEAWMDEIFNVVSSSGKYGVPAEICTLDLLGKDFSMVRRYELVGVYITRIDPLAYDIRGEGKPQEFTCSIAYQYWRQVS